ncbi:MAG: hemolysin activation protein [Bacteroidaceae bacterium]|nr:hemolysin activation protein [Bacteroidaceae bacterium]
MYKSEVDISVLILFFNRPKPLSKVFAEVRKARPARLFLYQDGPRGERDVAGIKACRKVVDNIDWECEVHQLYQDKNFGCDPSEYISQRWAFSQTDKCVVLEDDDVPSVSFFKFCKEMLDKYETDDRITMITGFNTDEISTDTSNDYFFTRAFSIWGWASWARVINNTDEHYSFLDNPEMVARIELAISNHRLRRDMLPMCRAHRATGKAYYETILWAYMVLHDGLAIMPSRNMINNLGNESDESVHYSGTLRCMPRDIRRQFTMRRFEMELPIQHHPKVVREDTGYNIRNSRRNAWGHPCIKIRHSLEELFLNIKYGNFGYIIKAIRNRLEILFNTKAN